MSEAELNVGRTLEESQKLVLHWHQAWAKLGKVYDELKAEVEERKAQLNGEKAAFAIEKSNHASTKAELERVEVYKVALNVISEVCKALEQAGG